MSCFKWANFAILVGDTIYGRYTCRLDPDRPEISMIVVYVGGDRYCFGIHIVILAIDGVCDEITLQFRTVSSARRILPS